MNSRREPGRQARGPEFGNHPLRASRVPGEPGDDQRTLDCVGPVLTRIWAGTDSWRGPPAGPHLQPRGNMGSPRETRGEADDGRELEHSRHRAPAPEPAPPQGRDLPSQSPLGAVRSACLWGALNQAGAALVLVTRLPSCSRSWKRTYPVVTLLPKGHFVLNIQVLICGLSSAHGKSSPPQPGPLSPRRLAELGAARGLAPQAHPTL